MIIFGVHSVEAALLGGKRIKTLHVLQKDRSDRTDELKSLARENSIRIIEYSHRDRSRFESEFLRNGGEREEISGAQGVFVVVNDGFDYVDYDDMLEAALTQKHPLILFLDSITDPQNLGAILRTAAFMGVNGIVIMERRSAPITATAIKVSSGAYMHVPVAQVTNLGQSIEKAQKQGFWIYGLSEHAEGNFQKEKFDAPTGLVIGNEEKGMRDRTEKMCDVLLTLPRKGAQQSLNAAQASAIALTLVRNRQDDL